MEVLDERVKDLKRMLVGIVHERRESGFYMLKYHLLCKMVESLQKFGVPTVVDSFPYKHFNVHIKHSCRTTLQRVYRRMIESLDVLQKSYKLALRCSEKRISRDFERIYERCGRVKQNRSYLVRHRIIITMDDLSRAVSVCEQTVSGTSLAHDLMELFGESTMQSFIALLHEIAEESITNVPDNKVHLAFLKSENMSGGHILTFRNVNLEKYVSENRDCLQKLCSEYVLLTDFGRLKKRGTVLCCRYS